MLSAACATTLDADAAAAGLAVCAPYKPFCPGTTPPDSKCYAIIRPKVYAPATYTSGTTAAVINLAEVQLLVGDAPLPNTSVSASMSTVVNWNNTGDLRFPKFLPLGPWFCNDGARAAP